MCEIVMLYDTETPYMDYKDFPQSKDFPTSHFKKTF